MPDNQTLIAEQTPADDTVYHVNRQEFTNLPGMYSGANVVLRVQDTSAYENPEDYLSGDYMMDIHDCYRRVHVYVNLDSEWNRHNSLFKVRKFAELACQYRDFIEKEIASIEAKEAARKAAETIEADEATELNMEGVQDLTDNKPSVIPDVEQPLVSVERPLARELPSTELRCSSEPTPENCKLWC